MLMRETIFWFGKNLFIYTVLCAAIFLMMRTSFNYSTFETNIQFLAYKQDYLQNPVWKSAFYTHVFSAFLALFAGLTQFSTLFMQRHRKAHRFLGHVYVWNILLINFPSALIMAIYANGGFLGKSAFLLLDCLWFGFTLQALRSAIDRKFDEHRDFMIRSYALTFSAITLRTWKIILTQTGWMDPSHIYVAEAWLGFLPNLLLAEVIIRSKKKSPSVETKLRQPQ